MKNKKLLTGILLAVLLVVITGISYALYSYDETGSANNIQSGKITFSFVEPSNSYVVENALPTLDEESERSDDYFEFKIISHATTNANDNVGVTIPYTVVLEKMTIDSGKKQLNENQIKVNLTTVASGVETDVVEPTLISNLEGYKTHSKVLYDTSVTHKNGSSELTTTYRLRAWIDYSVDASNWSTTGEYQYKFRININSEGEVEEVSKVVGSTEDWAMNIEPNLTGGYTITSFIGDIENSDNVKVVENYYTEGNLSPLYYELGGIESIEDMENKNAYNVTIPNVLVDENGNEYEVTEIGSDALIPMNFESGDMHEEYMRIKSIAISEGIETIIDGETEFGSGLLVGAFGLNVNLQSVTLPSTLKKIGTGTFAVTNISSITLNEELEEIGSMAFYMNPITTLELPSSLITIGEMAFGDCQLTTLVIPSSVKTIGRMAFMNNQISSLTLNEGLEDIGDSAFSANQIETLTIPSSVRIIGSSAFNGNHMLTLTLNEGLENIGEYCFSSNDFSVITIPSTVISIGDNALTQNANLTKIINLTGKGLPWNAIIKGENGGNHDLFETGTVVGYEGNTIVITAE